MNKIILNTIPRPLSTVETGTNVKVVAITGGRCCAGRLYSMGVTPGTILKVICSCGGKRIQLNSSCIALGHEMTQKIMVKPA